LKKNLVDELPNTAVEQAAVQLFTVMRNSKDASPLYIGVID